MRQPFTALVKGNELIPSQNHRHRRGLSQFITFNYVNHLYSNLWRAIYLSTSTFLPLASSSLLFFSFFQLEQNLHSIHRLDLFLCGIVSVRLVCQRRKIEKHRFEKITITDQLHGCSLGFYGENRPWWWDMHYFDLCRNRLQNLMVIYFMDDITLWMPRQ